MPEILLHEAIFIVIPIFFIFMYIPDYFQIICRKVGHEKFISTYTSHIASIIMLVNRLFSGAFLISSGLLIDVNADTKTFILTLCFSCFGLAGTAALMAANISRCESLVLKLVYLVYPDLDRCYSYERPNNFSKPRNYFELITQIITNIALYLGLLMPVIAAKFIPDFRATLLQSGFLLTMLGTLSFVLFVERGITAAIVLNPGSEADRVLQDYMIGKALGAAIVGAMIALLILWAN